MILKRKNKRIHFCCEAWQECKDTRLFFGAVARDGVFPRMG